MGYIYKITNKLNGKIYIGQTRQDIPSRWKQHVQQSGDGYHGKKTHFMYAIRKYGADAFVVEEIEECDNSLLNEREVYWIKEYDAIAKGYNLSIGGNGCQKIPDEEIMFWWNNGKTMIEISKVLPLHPETISRHLQRMGITHEEILKRGNIAATKSREFQVYQYDIDGNYIAEFESLEAARLAVGVKHIVPSGNGKRKMFGGYQWRKYKTDNIGSVRNQKQIRKKGKKTIDDKHKKVTCKGRKVVQFTLDGDYVRTFNSIRQAATETGGNCGAIGHACSGKNRHSGGYQWMYLEDAQKNGMKIGTIPFCTKSIPVHQYSLNGDYIASYKSLREAHELFGTKGNGGLRIACSNHSKQWRGYRWSYDRVDKLIKESAA